MFLLNFVVNVVNSIMCRTEFSGCDDSNCSAWWSCCEYFMHNISILKEIEYYNNSLKCSMSI